MGVAVEGAGTAARAEGVLHAAHEGGRGPAEHVEEHAGGLVGGVAGGEEVEEGGDAPRGGSGEGGGSGIWGGGGEVLYGVCVPLGALTGRSSGRGASEMGVCGALRCQDAPLGSVFISGLIGGGVRCGTLGV